jgi:hypothetical protein
MPAIEASTAVYLDSAQPSMTAVAARVTQQEQAIPADERIISAEIAAQPVELGNDELGLVLLARRERSRELLSFAQLRRRQTVLRELQTAQSREPGEATGNPRSGTTSASLGASVEEPKTQADRTVSQLIQFERLRADWDGNEAAQPLPFSLKDAREFIRALAPESVIPRPALHADGHAILFLRGPDVYAELEFLGKKRISFYARRGRQQWSDEIDFDGRTLPEGLSQIGFAL